MKAMISVLSAALCAAALADTSVYRLEMEGEQTFVVGVDGIRRPVVLVSPDEWCDLTGDVCRVISSFNATENGRIQLHGKRVQTFVDETERVKTTVYQDGYQFVEQLPASRPRVVTKEGAAKAPRSGYGGAYSARYRKMMEERAAAKAPRTVTVEHDAATGKDTVK